MGGLGMDTEKRIKSIVASVLGVKIENIKLGHSLQEDLGADSLNEIEIIMGIEDEFGIEIDEENLPKTKWTIKKIVKYITKLIEDK